MAARKSGTFVLVPLSHEQSGHITVQARLAGRPARFVVDTGAGGTIVDSASAAAYGLTLRRQSRKGGGVGSISMSMNSVAKHDLSLAGIDLSRTELLAMDLSHVNAGLKKTNVRPVVGVIGADVLWRHQATIDYGKGLMLLVAGLPSSRGTSIAREKRSRAEGR